jgi:hypothetical protein
MHVLQPMALVDDVLVLVLGSSLANWPMVNIAMELHFEI